MGFSASFLYVVILLVRWASVVPTNLYNLMDSAQSGLELTLYPIYLLGGEALLLFLGLLLINAVSGFMLTTVSDYVDRLWILFGTYVWGTIWLIGLYDKLQYRFDAWYTTLGVNCLSLAGFVVFFWALNWLIDRIPLDQLTLKSVFYLTIYVNTELFWTMVESNPAFDRTGTLFNALTQLTVQMIVVDLIAIALLYLLIEWTPMNRWLRSGYQAIQAISKPVVKTVFYGNLTVFVVLVACVAGELYASSYTQPPAINQRTSTDAQTATNQKNIIFIVVDTLRSDRTSLYGHTRRTTPELDKFAEEAVVFEPGISPTSWTAPSVASFFTGKTQTQHAAGRGGYPRLANQFNTLAEYFQQAGYTTAAFNTTPMIKADYGFGQGFDLYFDRLVELTKFEKAIQNTSWEFFLNNMLFLNLPPDEIKAREINEYLFPWLRQRAREPMFLYLHYFDPHYPYIPITDKSVFDNTETSTLNELNLLKYDLEIRDFDRAFGNLLDVLKEEGMFEDSLIVYTSDHGEEFREHGDRFHGKTLYGETIRVPTVFRFPDGQHAKKINHTAYGLDFFPTLLDFADIEHNVKHIRGNNLLPLITGDTPTSDTRAIFMENFYSGNYNLKAFRTPRWKLIHTLESPKKDDLPATELYNLNKDPGEQTDLSDSKPERTRLMLEKLRKNLEEVRKNKADIKQNNLDRDDIQQLKGLGYFE